MEVHGGCFLFGWVVLFAVRWTAVDEQRISEIRRCVKSYDSIAAMPFCYDDSRMELRHLRSFKTVAEELHFGRAAERLHVAQPALSRTIADLEAEMNVRLVERNSRGTSLTAAGELFLGRVRQLLEEADSAVNAAKRRARGETGSLRIGFIGTLGLSLIPRLVRDYRRLYPDVELTLRELGPTRQRQDILGGALDCGFIGLTSDRYDGELKSTLAAKDELMAAMPAEHPLAGRPDVALKELRDESIYLTARENAPVYNPWIIGLCRAAGFDPKIARETDRSATVLNYIAAGFGVSVFPAQIARFNVPGVVFVPLRGKVPGYEYRLAWKPGSVNPALVKFIELVKARRQDLGRKAAADKSKASSAQGEKGAGRKRGAMV
jgi:DNA-binding transcriptional LysR family regulator